MPTAIMTLTKNNNLNCSPISNPHMFLKKIILPLLSLLPILGYAQNSEADKILGHWMNEEKDGKIEIFKAGNSYSGKILDGKKLFERDGETLQKDVKNPDVKLRSRPLLNLIILSGFKYQDEEWTEGKVYDPKSGRTYNSTMKIKNDKLELRGFVGFSLLGRTTVWERVK
jgi:uncharacterized protein (DUF2147 family)